MAKAAYCSECSQHVWIADGGGCANGHPRSCLRGEYDALTNDVTGLPWPPARVVEAGPPRDARGAAAALSRGVWSYVGAVGQNLEARADRMRVLSEGSSSEPAGQPSTATARPRLSLRWGSDGFVWRESRYLVAGTTYVSASILGAAVLGLGGGHLSTLSAWVNLCMLVLVVTCMVTERNRSSVWQRVVFVFGAWIILGFVAEVLLFPFSVAFSLLLGGESPVVEAVITTLAGLPIVAYAMRLSTLFVTPKDANAGREIAL